MKKSVNNRLTSSWLAGVAVAAAILVPLRLGVMERVFTSPDFTAALADYLLTAGVGYFTGVFASLPLMILAGVVISRQKPHVERATGLWSASGALVLTCLATLIVHLSPLAHVISTGLELRLGLFDTFGFFLVCTGVSALAYQGYDRVAPPSFPNFNDNDPVLSRAG